MKQDEDLSISQIEALLLASEELAFAGQNRLEIYEWMERLLKRHKYDARSKRERGLLRAYAGKMTGLSRAQVTRLIGRWRQDSKVEPTSYRRHRFARRYTPADVALLAAVDEAHETLSGPATKRILEREYKVYGHQEYERLAAISVAHLYNLRQRNEYRQKRLRYVKTKAVSVPIGERRRPQSEGRPGYLRVDTVHQGDGPGGKGLYHVNAVDEVTQWQVVGAVETICERDLLPVMQSMLEQFPFRIRGFHSDNGSEYINYQVAAMLDRLRIGQTKSRPRHSNDNGLVESKNGAVIRKQIGYGYIEPAHARRLNAFYRDNLNYYLNYHRPSAQAQTKTGADGKQRRVYTRWATPMGDLYVTAATGRLLARRCHAGRA